MTSSKERADNLEGLGNPGVEAPSRGRPVTQIWQFFAERSKRVLLDLANLSEDCGYFRRHWEILFIRFESDQDLLQLRDLLRQAWDRGTDELGVFAHSMANQTVVRDKEFGVKLKWVSFRLRDRNLSVPNFFNLRMAITLAILELAPMLGRCGNPECTQPYFLKGRGTQKFCDNLNCAAFGQRQHKLNWWNQHGDEWRAEHKREKSRVRSNPNR